MTGIALSGAPASHVLVSANKPSHRDFGNLNLATCDSCSHVFNADTTVPTLHSSHFLTNTPVSERMTLRHHDLVSFSNTKRYSRVLDCGAGSGALSVAFAAAGHHVTAIEPSFQDGHKLTNVARVINQRWPVDQLMSEKFDLVLCVQVLEHTSDPLMFLESIVSVLDKHGYAYVEIPSGDWVFHHGSPLDVHLPHIQYFTDCSFRTLVSRVGCSVVSTRTVFEGRDVGYLISRESAGSHKAENQKFGSSINDFRVFEDSVSSLKWNMSQLPKEVALYGANAGSQALLGWIPEGPWAVCFDDTHAYWDNYVYSSRKEIPIIEPTISDLMRYEQILITAYNHDVTIHQKLLKSGFRGEIWSLRPCHTVKAGPDSLVCRKNSR